MELFTSVFTETHIESRKRKQVTSKLGFIEYVLSNLTLAFMLLSYALCLLNFTVVIKRLMPSTKPVRANPKIYLKNVRGTICPIIMVVVHWKPTVRLVHILISTASAS